MDKFAWIDSFVAQMSRRGVQAEPWQLVDRAEELYESWSEFHPALVAILEQPFDSTDEDGA